MNWCIPCTLVGSPMDLMAYNLNARGLTLSLITQTTRYSIFVRPNNYSSVFYFNPASASFCKTFSRDFNWSAKPFLVITSTLCMYICTISKPLNILDIFSWRISGVLQTPIGSFRHLHSPLGRKI